MSPSPISSRSRLLVPGSVPTTRSTCLTHLSGAIASAERPPQFEDLLGVKDLVVGGEEFLDGALVDLHLGAANAQGAPGADAAAVGALVGGLEALDARRRHGVEVDEDLQVGE